MQVSSLYGGPKNMDVLDYPCRALLLLPSMSPVACHCGSTKICGFTIPYELLSKFLVSPQDMDLTLRSTRAIK